MIEAHFRPFYQRLLVDPVANLLLHQQLIKPNQITLLSGIFGVTTFFALYNQLALLAVVCLALSGYCDTLDGSLARLRKNTTPAGTVLDIVIDRLVEFLLILGIYSVNPTSRSTLCLWMLGSILCCVTSFLVVGIFTEKQSDKSFYYSPGLIERPEAFIFFALMILFPQWFITLAWLFIVLVWFTTLLRIKQFCNYSRL